MPPEASQSILARANGTIMAAIAVFPFGRPPITCQALSDAHPERTRRLADAQSLFCVAFTSVSKLTPRLIEFQMDPLGSTMFELSLAVVFLLSPRSVGRNQFQVHKSINMERALVGGRSTGGSSAPVDWCGSERGFAAASISPDRTH